MYVCMYVYCAAGIPRVTAPAAIPLTAVGGTAKRELARYVHRAGQHHVCVAWTSSNMFVSLSLCDNYYDWQGVGVSWDQRE